MMGATRSTPANNPPKKLPMIVLVEGRGKEGAEVVMVVFVSVCCAKVALVRMQALLVAELSCRIHSLLRAIVVLFTRMEGFD